MGTIMDLTVLHTAIEELPWRSMRHWFVIFLKYKFNFFETVADFLTAESELQLFCFKLIISNHFGSTADPWTIWVQLCWSTYSYTEIVFSLFFFSSKYSQPFLSVGFTHLHIQPTTNRKQYFHIPNCGSPTPDFPHGWLNPQIWSDNCRVKSYIQIFGTPHPHVVQGQLYLWFGAFRQVFGSIPHTSLLPQFSSPSSKPCPQLLQRMLTA